MKLSPHIVMCNWMLLAVAILCQIYPSVAIGATKEQFESLFQKPDPYFKQKRMIDLADVTREEDVAIIRDAINPIILFLINYGQDAGPNSKFDPLVTKDGAIRLTRPHIPTGGKHHYYSQSKKNWKVIDPLTISLDVVFVDARHPNTTEYNFTAHFVFVKRNGGWKFDRHED